MSAIYLFGAGTWFIIGLLGLMAHNSLSLQDMILSILFLIAYELESIREKLDAKH